VRVLPFSRADPVPRLVHLRQTFVRRCQTAETWLNSSDYPEMLTHATCLLLWREGCDALAKLTELLQ
jgi:hypothetical protein